MAELKNVATKQLNASAKSGQESLLPVFAILLQGIAANTAKGDPEQYRQFRAKMSKVADLDDVRDYLPDLTLKAETTINLFQHYSARANAYFQAQISERCAAIDLLVGTLCDLAVAQPEHTGQLKEIAQQMHLAADTAALQQRKVDLAKCIAEIRQAAEVADPSLSDPTARDPATGLGGRHAAEAALAEACGSQSPACAVVLKMDRLKLYNQRYGPDVGDMALNFLAESVKRSFACEGALFRWSGPVLLMLQPGPPDKVQPEVRRVMESRLQYECESGSRHLLLLIDASWWVLPTMVDPRLLVNKIDGLVCS
ncbi:MAG: GGDEF domain-containing protein [Bryobacteraceae bacterium]